MRLLEILMLQKDLNVLDITFEPFKNDGIAIKIFKEENRSFMTLFGSNDEYVCSLEILKEKLIWNAVSDVSIDIELSITDITEDESYLVLKHGKYFGKDILDKIHISMDRLEEIVLDSIQKHNQGDNN